MSTATLPSVFALAPDERRAIYDDAAERAMDAAHEAAVASKARNKPDPRANDYLEYRARGLVCVLVVKHQDKPASFDCSRDGAPFPHVYLPFSRSVMQPESTEDFLLVCVPKW